MIRQSMGSVKRRKEKKRKREKYANKKDNDKEKEFLIPRLYQMYVQ